MCVCPVTRMALRSTCEHSLGEVIHRLELTALWSPTHTHSTPINGCHCEHGDAEQNSRPHPQNSGHSSTATPTGKSASRGASAADWHSPSKAEPALCDPFMLSKPVPFGELPWLPNSAASTRYSLGHVLNTPTVCGLIGNTVQKISP